MPTQVSQRQLKPMRNSPPDDPALVRVSELARTRQYAETIDDNGQIIGLGVFLAGHISNELAEAIDAALAAINQKLFGYPVGRMKAGGRCSTGRQFQASGSYSNRVGVSRRERAFRRSAPYTRFELQKIRGMRRRRAYSRMWTAPSTLLVMSKIGFA